MNRLNELAVQAGLPVKTLAFIKCENGEYKSPLWKFFTDTEKAALISTLAIEEGDIVFFVAGEWESTCTILGRTRAQLYKGEADWSLIAAVKNNPRIHIPIFGTGDIDSPQKAAEYRNRYGVDGIMIGRAAIGHPWIFREIRHYFETGELLAPPDFHERIDACRTHFEKSIAWKGEKVGIVEMRRHYAGYFKGISNFKEYRTRLVTARNQAEVEDIFGELAEQAGELVG
jgi:tRNA-dihydrouridine synthase